MHFPMNRMKERKLFFFILFVCVPLFLFISFPELLNQINESYFDTQKYESLNEGILHYYERNSWLDGLLCKDKHNKPIRRNVDDIIPFKILYREIWPSKINSRNIFIFEDNCQTTIPYFVQCTLESAAYRNPRSTIYLITVTPFVEDDSKTIQNLLNRYPNIIITQADYDSILKDTPLDSFRSPLRWTEEPDILKSHVNDALKLSLLWKEGGTFLDTDLISFKELPSDGNALLIEKDIIHGFFMKANKYHDHLLEIMKVQNSTYDGTWNSMGSLSIAEGISHYVKEPIINSGKYKDISVLPYKEFSGVASDEIEELFMTPPNANMRKNMEDSYGVHTNHFMMGDILNELGKNNLYSEIGRNFCPVSYHQNL